MSLRALLFRRPIETPTLQVAFDGAIYLVALRRHAQARRYTLRVQAATRSVVLTMPTRGSLREAKAFAQRNGGWIAARLKRLPQAIPFDDGLALPLRGVAHTIMHRPGARGTAWIEAGKHGAILCVAGGRAHLSRRVRDFLKKEAKRDLDGASRRHAAALGVKIKRISVRDQVSRWGSCTVDGVLSYSWRLVLAPPHVLDYLAAHEVAHLVEMNHSARFWRVVARICPDFERAKSWLNGQGNALHRYGADGTPPEQDAPY
ncbi:MAG TPA: SprT family zinc-dependent metalloprotease [Xanthobacteraceae bacterium]|nr:SprT family zinc-dependent metalloprotease [Xanthobacteraceae bacterium]